MKNLVCRRVASLLLAFALVLTVLAPGASAVTVNGSYVSATGLYILDYETGMEVYSYNGNKTFVPASITKLMTVYLTYQAVERGDISWDTQVPISANVQQQSVRKGYNNVPLYPGEVYTVEEIVNIVLVFSACGATIALAELLGGTEAEFVKMMNAEAKRLGIDATYYGADGIKDNYVTPKAMATLARHILMEYPEILDITSQIDYVFHGTSYPSSNNMLPGRKYYYPGVDGLKSGTTPNAGYCFVSTAEVNGVRLITVVLKASNTERRCLDTHVLLNYGFAIRDEKCKSYYLLKPYTDVYTTDWFSQQVVDIVNTGVMTGTSGTTFSPTQTLNHATTLTTLYRICGAPAVSYAPLFDDVPENQWFANAILWANAEGIAATSNRYDFGVFEPTSREQFALMLYHCAEYLELDTTARADLTYFADVNRVSPWAHDAVSWAVAEGLMTGITDTTLVPRGTTDRAQCATLLLRFLDYIDPTEDESEEPVVKTSGIVPPSKADANASPSDLMVEEASAASLMQGE